MCRQSSSVRLPLEIERAYSIIFWELYLKAFFLSRGGNVSSLLLGLKQSSISLAAQRPWRFFVKLLDVTPLRVCCAPGQLSLGWTESGDDVNMYVPSEGECCTYGRVDPLLASFALLRGK